jgi:hypothetical protein
MAKSAKRNITVASSKPAATVKPVATKPAPTATAIANAAAVPAVIVDKAPRGLTRDAAGIVRAATNFNQYSDRDTAYLAFFGTTCRANAGKATLRQIHDSGVTRSGMPDRKRFNPNYTGSGKATDVGAINRLIKAGYFTRSADGNTITATALATSSAAYTGSKA